MGDEGPKFSLSMWLTRPGAKLESVISVDKLMERPPFSGAPNGTRLFTYEAVSSTPWWQGYLGLSTEDFAGARRFGALLAVRVKGGQKHSRRSQHIVFTFGVVRHLIDQSGIVSNFGLHLAARDVKPHLILAADTFDVVDSRRQRTQLAQGRQLDFVDPDAQDRAVSRITAAVESGFPGNPGVLTARDSIRFAAPVVFSGLPDLAYDLFKRYESERRPVISLGHLSRMTNKAEIDQADVELVEAFIDGHDVTFAYPDIVDPDGTELIRFKGQAARPPLDGIDFEPFRVQLKRRRGGKRPATVTTLKNALITVSNSDTEPDRTIPLYRCLTATLDRGNNKLVLFEGQWFNIPTDYLARTTADIQSLAIEQSPFPVRIGLDHEEADYNMRVAALVDGICLDRTSILEDGPSDIEPCDILRLDGDTLVFTHVKPEHSSSTLSHLFYQAQVSASALLLDRRARKTLVAVIKKNATRNDVGLPRVRKDRDFTRDHKLQPSEAARRRRVMESLTPDLEVKLEQRKFRVEFVILHGNNNDPKKPADISSLPVFSRISLARAAREFRRLGIELSVRIVNDDRTS